MSDLLIFTLSAVLILIAGTRLARTADELADSTGLGEALMGAIFLGSVTSLPGITASVTAAWNGAPSLALSNAYGGIAVQTLFIAFADICYRRANLEHAAASLENMLMGVVLLLLLSFLVFASATPELEVFRIHPVSYLLPVIYLTAMLLIRSSRATPMWYARETVETKADQPDPENTRLSHGTLFRKWIVLVITAGIVIMAGWQLTESIHRISDRTGLDQSLAGALMVAVVTSLPELTTSLAAVRQGALTLAVSGILGGNAFDTLFAAVADYAYRPGPIFAYVSEQETGILSLSMAMAALILLGLLKRQRQGPAGIGFESMGAIILYFAGMAVLFLA